MFSGEIKLKDDLRIVNAHSQNHYIVHEGLLSRILIINSHFSNKNNYSGPTLKRHFSRKYMTNIGHFSRAYILVAEKF